MDPSQRREYKSKLSEHIKTVCYKHSEEPFTLSSGKKSNHYFDLRLLTFNPYMVEKAASLIVERLGWIERFEDETINCIGGLTMGADPLVYKISNVEKGYQSLIVRKEPKKHGTGKLVEGIIPTRPNCVVIDDVVTTAGSTIQAIKALRDIGAKIDYAFCILDREEGGIEALKELDVRLLSLFKKSDFGVGD